MAERWPSSWVRAWRARAAPTAHRRNPDTPRALSKGRRLAAVRVCAWELPDPNRLWLRFARARHADEFADLLRRDIDAAHAREIAVNPGRVRQAVERGAQFLMQHAAVAGRIVAIEHQHIGNTGQ